MSKTSPAKKKKSFRWMKVLLLLLVAIFVARLYGQINKYFDLQGEVQAYEGQLAQAEEVYQAKLNEIELFSNGAYMERIARERLGMVKEGEDVVLTVDTDLPATMAVDGGIDTSLRE